MVGVPWWCISKSIPSLMYCNAPNSLWNTRGDGWRYRPSPRLDFLVGVLVYTNKFIGAASSRVNYITTTATTVLGCTDLFAPLQSKKSVKIQGARRHSLTNSWQSK